MIMNHKLYFILLFLLVSMILMFTHGCSTQSIIKPSVSSVEITTVAEQIDIFHPPLPDSVKWEDFSWVVITPEILNDMVKKLEKGEISEDKLVFFAISPKDYERLSVNMAEIKRFLSDQRSIIMYYRSNVPKEIYIKKPETNK